MVKLWYCIHRNDNDCGGSYDFLGFEAEAEDCEHLDPKNMDRLVEMWRRLSDKTKEDYDIDGVGIYTMDDNGGADYCVDFVTNDELEELK